MKAIIEFKDPDFEYSISGGTDAERRKIGRKGRWGEYFEVEIEFGADGKITGGKFIKPRD